MKAQNQIKRTLSEETSLLYLKDLLDRKTFHNRIEVAKEVCQEFDFYNPKGQAQLTGCAKALRTLETAGHIKLPPPVRKAPVKRMPQRLNIPVPIPVDVPSTVNEVQDLELILVQNTDETRI